MRWLRVLGVLVALVVVGVLAFSAFVYVRVQARLGAAVAAHEADIPLPFPLTEAEIEELRAARAAAQPVPPSPIGTDAATTPAPDPLDGVDLAAVASERAVERGKHLMLARLGCGHCHADDLGGGTMVDDAAMGRFLAPNLTLGVGSATRDYGMADWDRAVRHGIGKSGNPLLMPIDSAQHISDRELSDVVAYIRDQPPVDRTIEPSSLGPVGTLLVWLGEFPLGAESIADHRAPHAALPPDAAPTAAFGAHIAPLCAGCHNPRFSGGSHGDPSWPPALNLTQHADGLGSWTFEQFVGLLREGRRRDGSAIGAPMDMLVKYTGNLTDTEVEALWAFLKEQPVRATGE